MTDIHAVARHLVVLAIVLATSARPAGAQSWPIVFPPISEMDVADYGLWMDLHEDEQARLADIHSQYLDALESIAEDRAMAIAARVDAVAAYSDVQSTDIAELGATAIDLTQAYEQKRALIEETTFWVPIGELVGPDRRDQLGLVRNSRARELMLLWSEGIPREGSTDLSRMLMPVSEERQEQDPSRMVIVLTDEEWALIEPTLRAWDASTVSILRAHYTATSRVAKLRFVAADLGAFLYREGPAMEEADLIEFSAELNRMNVEIRRAQASACERLPMLTRRAMKAIHSSLPPPKARAFWELYLGRSYPKTWPDPMNAYLLLAQAMALPDLTWDQLEAVEAIAISYRDRHDKLTMRMCDTRLERVGAALSGDRGSNADWVQRVQRLDQKTDEAGLEREELNLGQKAALSQVLAPAQIAKLPPNPAIVRPWARTDLARLGAGSEP